MAPSTSAAASNRRCEPPTARRSPPGRSSSPPTAAPERQKPSTVPSTTTRGHPTASQASRGSNPGCRPVHQRAASSQPPSMKNQQPKVIGARTPSGTPIWCQRCQLRSARSPCRPPSRAHRGDGSRAWAGRKRRGGSMGRDCAAWPALPTLDRHATNRLPAAPGRAGGAVATVRGAAQAQSARAPDAFKRARLAPGRGAAAATMSAHARRRHAGRTRTPQSSTRRSRRLVNCVEVAGVAAHHAGAGQASTMRRRRSSVRRPLSITVWLDRPRRHALRMVGVRPARDAGRASSLAA